MEGQRERSLERNIHRDPKCNPQCDPKCDSQCDPYKDRHWDLGPEERQQHISALVRSPIFALDPALTRLGLRIQQRV